MDPTGYVLTFFDDCHGEIDGEDSVHFRKNFRVDARTNAIYMDGLKTLRIEDGYVLVETDRGSDDFFAHLQGAGRWSPISQDGGAARGPVFPQACLCPSSGCGG